MDRQSWSYNTKNIEKTINLSFRFNILNKELMDNDTDEGLLSDVWLFNFLQPNYQRMLRLFKCMTTFKEVYPGLSGLEIIDKIYTPLPRSTERSGVARRRLVRAASERSLLFVFRIVCRARPGI